MRHGETRDEEPDDSCFGILNMNPAKVPDKFIAGDGATVLARSA